MKRLFLTTLLLIGISGTAVAGDYDIDFSTATDEINQKFGDIVREAGIVTAYRGIAPAEPLGLLGFDIGVETSVVDIDTSTWDPVIDAGQSDPPSVLPIPRIHARKGLPFNIDVGASYASVPDSNIEIVGAELQWALLEGTMATPALAVRGHYGTLGGVDDLDIETYGADALVSKGFAMLTPYAGLGIMEIDGRYTGDDTTLQDILEDQTKTETRIFGGVQISIALLALTLEAEYSEIPVYSGKLSLNW
ncbi:MAG: hypothetical protein GWO11_08020 [Desulfuromonadales bacterium]|nr:hypothetical protein [Desulfuromonadales bacterium]NIR34259.1 hypothetical protein [Desulfuromonadales bacterium]NIS42805.1 hypothetical protein [Desulfuromonadales bacterium]